MNAGLDSLRSRFKNRGTAFTAEERRELGIRGRLPASLETLDDQVKRCESQLRSYAEPLHQYQFLRSLHDANVTLFFAIVCRNLEEILPIIYTPTVGLACQRFSQIYAKEHGLYVTLHDRGSVRENLRRGWPRACEVEVVVITDGSRILGLGDLGANGMGISIGKASLYVAGAGINPRRVLPVMLDVGTNNDALRDDPMYLGLRSPRCADDRFYEILDEFMETVATEMPRATIQFEDFSNNHCFDMLRRYRDKYRCFNDDIQGTGAVVSAGVLNALRLVRRPLEEHRIVVYGAGSAAVGVVAATVNLLSSHYNVAPELVTKRFYLVDTRGLVSVGRGGRALERHKLAFARRDVGTTPEEHLANWSTLEQVVASSGATAVIGLAGVGPAFSEHLVRGMAARCERPIIFALSNPTSKSEITPDDAFRWTAGRAIVSTGSPFPVTHTADGTDLRASQGNNMYVFPGVGLASTLAQPRTISDDAMRAAAAALAEMVPDDALEKGLYPSLCDIRPVSAVVAAAVMRQFSSEGVTMAPVSALSVDMAAMWQPKYVAPVSRL